MHIVLGDQADWGHVLGGKGYVFQVNFIAALALKYKAIQINLLIIVVTVLHHHHHQVTVIIHHHQVILTLKST